MKHPIVRYVYGHAEIPDGTPVEVLQEVKGYPRAFVRLPTGGTRYVFKQFLREEKDEQDQREG